MQQIMVTKLLLEINLLLYPIPLGESLLVVMLPQEFQM